MGATITLQTDSGKHSPVISGDLKWLGHYLVGAHLREWSDWPDVIGNIAERFQIDLAPIEKVFDPNSDEAAAWEVTAQPPGELADCLRRLVQALTNNPSVFSGMELAPLQLAPEHLQGHREYFLEGHFLEDLTDLLREAEWAEKSGEERVRLYYG